MAVLTLVGLGLAFMAIGLTLMNDTSCLDTCQTLALTLLHGGLPVSAALGILFGGVLLAWPLDLTFWVVLGFGLSRWSEARDRNVLGTVLAVEVLALAYGLVLSSFVELAIQS